MTLFNPQTSNRNGNETLPNILEQNRIASILSAVASIELSVNGSDNSATDIYGAYSPNHDISRMGNTAANWNELSDNDSSMYVKGDRLEEARRSVIEASAPTQPKNNQIPKQESPIFPENSYNSYRY